MITMDRVERTSDWRKGDILATSQNLYELVRVSKSGRHVVVVNKSTGKVTTRVSDDFERWS